MAPPGGGVADGGGGGAGAGAEDGAGAAADAAADAAAGADAAGAAAGAAEAEGGAAAVVGAAGGGVVADVGGVASEATPSACAPDSIPTAAASCKSKRTSGRGQIKSVVNSVYKAGGGVILFPKVCLRVPVYT